MHRIDWWSPMTDRHHLSASMQLNLNRGAAHVTVLRVLATLMRYVFMDSLQRFPIIRLRLAVMYT
jgi:hypothetical protein